MFTEKDMRMMDQIRWALQMAAASFSPAQAREVAMIYPEYQVGKTYAADPRAIEADILVMLDGLAEKRVLER